MKQESSYMIGGEDLSADWRWPKGHPEWRMSSKEGIRWEDDGPLNETGRKMLLKHFGLELVGRHLPIKTLATMSPAALLRKRRGIERRGGLERLEPVSDRPGGHISAKLAA